MLTGFGGERARDMHFNESEIVGNYDGSNHTYMTLHPTNPCTIRKKRIRNKRIVIHRVLKNDIRKLYPQMWANVCNVMDFNLFTSFFTTFCMPDIVFQHHFAKEVHDFS